jgi:hypothetical protein
MKDVTRKLTTLLASKTFFYVILGFFIFEALWFVFSAIYPMAFDEDFHFGVIKIYAEQWSPFLTSHPEGADKFGAIVRDPSYFFHYLMSFPYRFIALFTSNEATQVIFLRLINVGLFAWSLVLFRRVLLHARTSPALTNTALAVLVLIPIVPQLAAHINYDNLLMVLVAWLCLVTFRLVDSFRQQRVDGLALGTFIALCLFTSVVKYAALPLLVAAVLFVAIMAYRNFRGKGKRLAFRLKDGWLRIGKKTKIALLVVLVAGTGLFVQRYVVNTIQYGHPVPDCGKVLSVEQCSQYGPWGRDHGLEQSKSADFQPDFGYYLKEWFLGMRHRLFFAINGPKAFYHNLIELPVPVATATVVFVIGLLATIIWWRQVFQGNAYYVFFALLIGIYVLVLFYDQYGMYKQTSVPVAINGRYILPVFLPMAALFGAGVIVGLRKFKLEKTKPYLAALVILLFLHGGGLLTFILRSDANWYWPNSAVEHVNNAARNVLAPIIIEGDKNADWH